MAELEKVIKWLDVCKTSHYAVGIKEDYPCRLCPYYEKEYCMKQLITDALELLKEKEPVYPTWQQGKMFCGACGAKFPSRTMMRFCHRCGREIKLNVKND